MLEAGGEGAVGSEESLFNRYRVSVWDDEKVPEMGDGEDGWLQNNVYVLNATEMYT